LKIRKILVSQPEPTTPKSPYFDLAEQNNVKIDFRPFIQVEGIDVKEFRQQKVSILDHGAVIFTSRTAIDIYFRIAEEMRLTIPDSMKYFCISEATAFYLQKYIVYRKRKIFFSQTGRIEGLSNYFTKHSKEKFLFPLPEEHNEDITQLLDQKKLDYTKSVMYRTVSNTFPENEKLDYDMIIFFSPLGIQSLVKNFPDYKQGDTAIGCFGSTTAKAVEEAGFRLDCEAPQPEYPSMVAALDAFLKENHKHHN